MGFIEAYVHVSELGRAGTIRCDAAFEDNLLEFEAILKRHIQRVLEKTGGKIHGPGGAGERLGVNPNTRGNKN